MDNQNLDQSENGDFLIEDFLRNKDVAPWFRGTSIFHIRGANQLFNAIRDDTEQRTAHRVMNCLNLIGLDPMVTAKEIKFLMRLSRGNDLAFLWFLMEMHYKSPKPGTYSVNEQLICSAISHLDMITTLRELDKILPSPKTSHTQAQQKSNEPNELVIEANKTKARGPKYILPYFEKLRRPVSYGKALTIEIPNFEVDFYIYAAYKDPNHVVANESNRWYAEYDFNPGRRVAYDIIRNAISDIFENFAAAKLKANTIKTLCQQHKTLKKIEENMKHELRVQVRDKCLKSYFGNTAEKQKERLQRVKESLHKAIGQELCAFRKQTTTARKQLTLQTLTSECEIVDVVVGEEYDECCLMSRRDQNVKTNPQKPLTTGAGDTVAENPQTKMSADQNEPKGIGDFVDDAVSRAAVEHLRQTQIDLSNVNMLIKGQSPSQVSLFAQRYMQNYDYGHMAETPKSSQTYFRAPSDHKPYQFDYRKIFLHKAETGNSLKRAFLEALDRDITTMNELEEAQSKLEVIASECASDTWRKELQVYEAQQTQDNNELVPARTIDAEDKNLMDKMLANAFELLRTNPKFVLAQLPEPHKLPMLREWISRRYGKVYTPKQRFLSYQYSLKVFHALDRMTFDLPTPTATELGKNQFVSYNCRNYLAKKIKHIKDKFYRRLDNEIMKQSRNYWFATRGYLCSNGPPRQTFFAYMPSRFRDIQHFRLWKSNEHRPDKTAWDKRMLAKKAD